MPYPHALNSAELATPRAWRGTCHILGVERNASPPHASPHASPHAPCPTLHAFTLVEILVVLVVMAILMLIGMPAFEKIAKGQGAELAAREMVGKLKAVRAYAVSNRVYTALVLPSDELPDDYRFRSYRAAVVDSLGAFQYWVPNEKWNTLPTGVAFLDITSGAADTPDPAHSFLGAMPAITNADFSDMSGTSPDNKTLNAVVFKPNGRLKSGNKTYLHLGEGKYSGGSLIVTNPDPNAYVTVNIDQYSGRVSYGKE